VQDDDIILSVSNVSKRFEIYDKPVHRLYQTLCAGYKTFYKEFWALRDVSFDVRRGECVGIIGPNGAGKSTLLQIITGTLQQTSGDVMVKGRVAALLELGSGFNPEFTGRENIFLNGAILGLSHADIVERYSDIVAFADIGEFIDRPVKTYSSGMMVRLAFAVNAFVDPDILIVDEALAVGDIFFQQKCMRFLRDFIKRKTLLFVSHDTGAVKNICTRAIYLEHGQLQRLGAAKDVVEEYMRSFYASMQNVDGVDKAAGQVGRQMDVLPPKPPSLPCEKCFRDMRHDYVTTTNLRNDLMIFSFGGSDRGYGTGEATIRDVYLTDEEGRRLSGVVGGEMVRLVIEAVANEDIADVIDGFAVKDRLGQWLFAENTFLTYKDTPVSVPKGKAFRGIFEFRMPIMPKGDYTVMASVACGTQLDHRQLHYIDDAVAFKSEAPMALSLMGIPFRRTELQIAN